MTQSVGRRGVALDGRVSHMKVAVFGLGYVGTVTAACLASADTEVVGVDPDLGKVGVISRGESPVVEPGLDVIVETAVQEGWLRATSDVDDALEGADIALLCVGTPSRMDGSGDLRYIERAAEQIGTHLKSATKRLTVIVRSTVPPGSVEGVVAPAIERASGLTVHVDFDVAMCPEFLREGQGVSDFYDPELIVIGCEQPSAARTIAQLFSSLPVEPVVTEIRTAEAIKYACNAYHAVKVSFANEFGRLCQVMGVDTREVMSVFCQDKRLNISTAYLRPGFAFGGSCLPKDLRALLHMARVNSVDLPLLQGTEATNDLIVRNVTREVLYTTHKRVAMLGLSFKPETDDLRESPYVELAESLLGKGLEVQIYDPVIRPERLIGGNLRYVDDHLPHLRRLLVDAPEEALAGAEVVLVASSSEQVKQALLSSAPPVLIDLVGSLGPEVEALPGYRGVSW